MKFREYREILGKNLWEPSKLRESLTKITEICSELTKNFQKFCIFLRSSERPGTISLLLMSLAFRNKSKPNVKAPSILLQPRTKRRSLPWIAGSVKRSSVWSRLRPSASASDDSSCLARTTASSDALVFSSAWWWWESQPSPTTRKTWPLPSPLRMERTSRSWRRSPSRPTSKCVDVIRFTSPGRSLDQTFADSSFY